MNASIVYVYPLNSGVKYDNYALRFIESYQRHRPTIDHETILVINRGKPTSELRCMFSLFPHLRFIEHDNSGYDIGSFQRASRECSSDMIVFFGTSTFLNCDGWLERMLFAFQKNGNAQYGAMGNRGNIDVKVWPHIRTTAFWMTPALFNSYPKIIKRPEERHPFEHGQDCFTSWVKSRGLKSWVITKTGEYLWKNWDDDPNGYQKGNQGSMLAGDRMCERPYFKTSRCVAVPNNAAECSPWRSDQCWPCMTH